MASKIFKQTGERSLEPTADMAFTASATRKITEPTADSQQVQLDFPSRL